MSRCLVVRGKPGWKPSPEPVDHKGLVLRKRETAVPSGARALRRVTSVPHGEWTLREACTLASGKAVSPPDRGSPLLAAIRVPRTPGLQVTALRTVRKRGWEQTGRTTALGTTAAAPRGLSALRAAIPVLSNDSRRMRRAPWAVAAPNCLPRLVFSHLFQR